MKTGKKRNRIFAGILTLMLTLVLGTGFSAVEVRAESGTVYTCTITPCYAHPVTGVIEDSGGESSYTTGQGMVEGCIYTTGILEVTDSGNYYLTFRMSLMDYTSGHSFLVQSVGDSQWYTPATGQTGSGTDSNGTTADVCVQVPSENSVVRISMYVQPMGRDVIFYLYPSNYSAGNTTNMNATMVTAASGSGSSSTTSGSATTGSGTGTASGTNSSSSSGTTSTTSESSSMESSSTGTTTAEAATESTEDTSDSSTELESSITEAAAPTTDSSTLDSAEGLSLSTAEDNGEEAADTSGTSNATVFGIAAAVTVCGLILMGTAAGIIYFMRKNWRRWGGGEDDDE